MRRNSGSELIRRGNQAATKLMVSVVTVGLFVIYSLLHARSGATPAPTSLGGGASGAATTTTAPGATSTTTSTAVPGALYRDGTYNGDVSDAQWGYVQVQVTVQRGKVANVQFLQYPNDRDRSVMINQYADPILIQEAVQAQSAQVDVVSGATDTSEAFMQSLGQALDQAHV